jgi:rod shape-determining protein MreC
MLKIKRNNPLALVVAVAALLLFLHGIGWLRPLENLLVSAVKPLAGAMYNWGGGLKPAAEAGVSPADWAAKIVRLDKEVAALTVANSRSAEISDENRKLRALLNFSESHDWQTVAAGVIARDEAAAGGRGLIINRGARDGLRPGLAVVSEAGVIVGQVLAVKDTTAAICLTTSPHCQLAAAFQNQTKTQGLTDGDLGLTIKMSYIPQLEKISVGDTVITSGLGGNIPRGLVIGRVASVKNESNEVWQEATIEPLLDLNRLTVVAVIIPS